MTLFDAKEAIFEEMYLFGKPALLTILPLDYESLPEGMYVYELRYETNPYRPLTIMKHRADRHYGTLILNTPLELGENDELPIANSDLVFGGNSYCTVKRYLEKNGVQED